MLPVVVLAGGLGTRLAPVTRAAIPKALVEVNGRPFIDYKLAGLARDGARDVVLLIGALGEQVEAHVGSGEQWGLRVRYRADGPVLLGTGGAVRAATDLLPESFWVTYCDTYLQFDLNAAEASFAARDILGLMTVLHNEDRLQPSNVRVEDGLVVSYRKDPPPGTHAHIDYGMFIVHRDAFAEFAEGTRFDLGDVFRSLAASRRLGAFEVTERFYSVGDPDELRETADYLASDAGWDARFAR